MKKEEQAIIQTDPEELLDLLDEIAAIGRIADCLLMIQNGLKATSQSPELERALHVVTDSLEVAEMRIEAAARKLFSEGRDDE